MVSNSSAALIDLPYVDDHLVEPGTPFEMWDGELVYVPPCDAPHGARQAKLAGLIEAHLAAEFSVACELLTRTSKIDDIAPDISVYPTAPDPVTGRRQLQQIAFEVASTQTLADAGRKARKLAGRGVRRVFAIELRRARVLEWSTDLDDWAQLAAVGDIVDPVLSVPLPIAPLLTAAHTDDVVARALIAKENPEVMQYRAEGEARGRAEGEAKGRAESLLSVLAARGIVVDPASRLRILGEHDRAQLERWLARVANCRTVAELLAP